MITQIAEEELLRLIEGNVKNSEVVSSILSEPLLIGKFNTNFLNDVKKSYPQLQANQMVIERIRKLKNFIIVLCNVNLPSRNVSVFIVYNDRYEWICNIDKCSNDSANVKDLPHIYDFNINRKGVLYGISNSIDNDNVKHFFLFNDILYVLPLLDPQGIIDNSFFSTIFDIETEVQDPQDPTTLLYGSKYFKNMGVKTEVYSFSQDFKEDYSYAFAIWDKTTKFIHIAKITTDEGQLDASQTQWEINQEVSFNQTNNTLFEGLTSVSIATQLLNSNNSDLQGSIIYTTQNDNNVQTTENVDVKESISPISKTFTARAILDFDDSSITPTPNTNYAEYNNWYHGDRNDPIAYKVGQTKGDFVNEKWFKQSLFINNDWFKNYYNTLINPIVSNVNNIIKTNETIFNIKSTNSTNQVAITFKDADVQKLLITSNAEVYVKTTFRISAYSRNNPSEDFSLADYVTIQSDSNLIIDFKDGTTSSYDMSGTTLYNGFDEHLIRWDMNKHPTSQLYQVHNYFGDILGNPFEDVYFSGSIQARNVKLYWIIFDSSNWQLDVNWSGGYQVAIGAHLNYDRKVDIAYNNTTQQIVMESNSSSSKYLSYNIFQAENSSYKATEPYFLNGYTAYIPLKTKDGGVYNIYKFIGDKGQNQVDIERIFLDAGTKDYSDASGDSYKATLYSPTSIVSVSINDIVIPNTRYTLAGNILTITGIKSNDLISVIYKTKVGAPAKLTLLQSTTGDNLFIGGLDDNNELGVLNINTIFGAGDDSFLQNGVTTQSKIFGFNLYNSVPNIEYDSIAENIQTVNDFKVRHVLGVRQKDVIWIYAYNEDYTSYYKWVQVYSNGFIPYTNLPYNNDTNKFKLDRLSVNKDLDKSKTVFDRGFLDATTRGNDLYFTTQAEITDLNNQDNNKVVLFGNTNIALFNYDRTITKTNFENVKLDVRIKTTWIDNLTPLTGYKIINKQTNEFSQIFISDLSSDIYKNITFGISTFTFNDNSTKDFNTKDYLIRYDEEKEIHLQMSLININKIKWPTNLIIKSENGDVIIDYNFNYNSLEHIYNIDITFNFSYDTDGTRIPDPNDGGE